jgi:uncharacterized protein (TIGR00369 family)
MDRDGKRETADNPFAIVRKAWEQSPFNRLLGFKLDHVDAREGQISFTAKPELIGNFHQGILHGGVIASAIDTVGGLAAYASVLARAKDPHSEETVHRMARMGTIDMRIDYLRPGKGTEFRCTGTVLRTGRKVAVTRMELFDGEGTLIAAGTGAYMVG